MLKINTIKYISILSAFLIIVACSTKKNSLVGRNLHAMNSKYNILYNGGLALDAGITEVKAGYSDNFWEVLPVERMQIEEEAILPGQKGKNANFERAETKAVKAIQKHSMNIGGKEKNSQMDEAHLMLGKARYYDKRYIPALEAFNYILYKYSNSDKINEAKVWREKTNIRLENDGLAVKNLQLLLKKNKLKKQVEADANAVLAQALINLGEKDSAIAPLKVAIEKTKRKEEKARYRFILGQLYQNLKHNDSAYTMFQEVIQMKRKSPRMYVVQAHAKQGQLIDVTKDTVAFLKKYKKLLKDRENRPYLDALNYQVALFYDKLGDKGKAITFYNKSLKAQKADANLQLETYKNLATIYFDKAQYVTAGKYYDSTLTKFAKKNRDYFKIAKKRQNLDDVIKYEGIVKNNDSIVNIASLSVQDKESFYADYIKKLKTKDSIRIAAEKKKEETNANNANGIQDIKGFNSPKANSAAPPMGLNAIINDDIFYFYTPTTVAYGKVEFAKQWGKRSLKENWRWDASTENTKTSENFTLPKNENSTTETNEKYTTSFYIKKLPTSTIVLDSLAKERNLANYQLGVIYKEKFLENNLAKDKFETVLSSNSEERLLLPSKYNLYKIYEQTNPDKATQLKNEIISMYPNTRYAQILRGNTITENNTIQTPSEAYTSIYKQFEKQEYTTVLQSINTSIIQFSGEDILPKFELLKATVIGKLQGLEAYKTAIAYVANTYPDTKEAQQADIVLKTNIPQLEKMAFSRDTISTKWKVLYKIDNKDDATKKELTEKIQKYIQEKQYEKFSVSCDIYNENENFIVIHGISSKEFAHYFVELLRDTKEYKIKTPAVVLSSENYAVIQVRKNFHQFLELKI